MNILYFQASSRQYTFFFPYKITLNTIYKGKIIINLTRIWSDTWSWNIAENGNEIDFEFKVDGEYNLYLLWLLSFYIESYQLDLERHYESNMLELSYNYLSWHKVCLEICRYFRKSSKWSIVSLLPHICMQVYINVCVNIHTYLLLQFTKYSYS